MNSQEFEQLLALVIEDEASAEQVAGFTKLIDEDADLLEQAKTHFALHAQLGVAMESEFDTEKFIHRAHSHISQLEGAAFSGKVVKEIKQRRWMKRVIAIAAVFIIGCIAMISNLPSSSSTDNPENLISVASITRMDGVQWQENAADAGDSIMLGQSIKIDAGLLEIDLDGRGSLLIEGPAHIDFSSATKAIIHSGSLVMRATEKGHGYTVKTPQGSVIDLGTEFAVSVGKDNLVETHVIEGSVEAISNDGKSVTLLRNDALRFDENGGEPITADVGRFYTSMPPIHQQVKFIHWSFDDEKASKARAQGDLGEENSSNDLIFHSTDEGAIPRSINGMRSPAIQLDGKGAYAESSYQGIQGANPRTVSFWVKVPKQFSILEGFGIVSWGNPKELGETWQISVNPLIKQGEVGRLRLGLHGGQIIGSTDLRDDQWHHIAVVLYGGSQPNVGTHALLYVDGKKETVTRASLQEVKTTTQGDDHGVWVGRNVTYRDNSGQHQNGRFFRGGVDELYIFDVALSQSDIQELMKK